MDTYARRSLLSVVLTALVITINHMYVLGPRALVLGAVLALAPVGLLWWFRSARSRVAFVGYLLINLWIVVGFGLVKGLWDVTLQVFLGTLLASLSSSFPRPTLGTFGFEASGILTFIGSLFVLYYGYRFVEAEHTGGRSVQPPATATLFRKWLPGGSILALTLVAAFVLKDQDRWTRPERGIVKIGVLVPRSGPYAMLGNSFLKAVEMARDDLHGTRYQYQLVTVDIGQEPRQARAAIRHMIQKEKVRAIVGGISLFGQVTKPLATAARIPHTCVCTVASIGDGAYNFTNIPSSEAEAMLWVQEARRRGIRNIALLTQAYPSIRNHVKALKAEATRAGLSVVSAQEFADSIRDFRSMIARGSAAQPDVFYVEALEPQLDVLGRQLVDAKVRNIASVVAPSLSEHPELFEGAWYTDSNLRDIAFRQRFERQYPGTRFATHMMPYAYDDFNMIVQAFERGQNPAVYLRDLFRYEGTAGPLTRAPGSGNFQSTPAVWTIRKGEPAQVSHHQIGG